MSEGIREDSAPDEETLPISSWLNRAMQFTLPLRVEKDCAATCSAMASTAQKLDGVSKGSWFTLFYDSRRYEIVTSGTENEFVVQSSQRRRLSIIQCPIYH